MVTQGQTSAVPRRLNRIPRPSKEELLVLLMAYTIGEIAERNITSRQTVTKWLYEYGIRVGRGRRRGRPT